MIFKRKAESYKLLRTMEHYSMIKKSKGPKTQNKDDSSMHKPESKDLQCVVAYMTFWRRQNNMDKYKNKQDLDETGYYREMKIGVKTVTNESNCITNGWHVY